MMEELSEGIEELCKKPKMIAKVITSNSWLVALVCMFTE
jgi:hypothetical protein